MEVGRWRAGGEGQRGEGQGRWHRLAAMAEDSSCPLGFFLPTSVLHLAAAPLQHTLSRQRSRVGSRSLSHRLRGPQPPPGRAAQYPTVRLQRSTRAPHTGHPTARCCTSPAALGWPLRHAAGPLSPAPLLLPCAFMGQQASKELEREEARLQELSAMIFEMNLLLLGDLSSRQAAEKAAGIPAAPGSAQALYNAAVDNCERLEKESDEIKYRICEYRRMQQAHYVRSSRPWAGRWRRRHM